jgi:NDP-sugar pyrophosphorylase family protein
MQAVILAGGLGTRMRPFTEKAPKCLLPVRGRPFIDYQIELLKAGGIREIVLCLGYLGEMVQGHLGDGASHGVNIQYSWDSPESGGTAGALKHAEPLLNTTFFLTWGDSYVRLDHATMFAAHRASAPDVVATMGVFCNQNAYDSSNVQIGGNKVVRYLKGAPDLHFTHIDAGISVFERSALGEIPSNQNLALDQFFSLWAARGRLGAYPIDQRFYEAGSRAGLSDFERFIAGGGDTPT